MTRNQILPEILKVSVMCLKTVTVKIRICFI